MDSADSRFIKTQLYFLTKVSRPALRVFCSGIFSVYDHSFSYIAQTGVPCPLHATFISKKMTFLWALLSEIRRLKMRCWITFPKMTATSSAVLRPASSLPGIICKFPYNEFAIQDTSMYITIKHLLSDLAITAIEKLQSRFPHEYGKVAVSRFRYTRCKQTRTG